MERLAGIKRIFVGALVVFAIGGGAVASVWTKQDVFSGPLAKKDDEQHHAVFIVNSSEHNEEEIILHRGQKPCKDQDVLITAESRVIKVGSPHQTLQIEKKVEGDVVHVRVTDGSGRVLVEKSKEKPAVRKASKKKKQDKPSAVKTFFKAAKVVIQMINGFANYSFTK